MSNPKQERSAQEALLLEKSLQSQVITQDYVKDGAEVQEANAILRELGQEIAKTDVTLSKMEYMGSAAVHIYRAKALGQTNFFVSQVETLDKIPEALASAAFTNLQHKMMSKYGRKERRRL